MLHLSPMYEIEHLRLEPRGGERQTSRRHPRDREMNGRQWWEATAVPCERGPFLTAAGTSAIQGQRARSWTER